MSDCLFCKIVAGDIPADKLYEDDDLVALRKLPEFNKLLGKPESD